MAQKILFIVGSLRKRSFNRQLAEKAREIIGSRADVSFLEWADVPFFNQDAEFPVPAAVARVRKASRVDWAWMKLSEESFAEDWLSPEDEEAWRDL